MIWRLFVLVVVLQQCLGQIVLDDVVEIYPIKGFNGVSYVKEGHTLNVDDGTIKVPDLNHPDYVMTFAYEGTAHVLVRPVVSYDKGDVEGWLEIQDSSAESLPITELDLVSGTKVAMKLVMNSSIMPSGYYSARVVFQFFDGKTRKFLKDFTRVFSVRLNAEPDYLTSVVDFEACRKMNWTETCNAKMILLDRDGFNATAGLFTQRVKAALKKVGEVSANAESSEEKEFPMEIRDLDGEISISFQSVVTGIMIPIVRINDVAIPIDETETFFEVSCGGEGTTPDPNNKDRCICSLGYELNGKAGYAQCSRCAPCKSGEVLREKGNCVCEKCLEGYYCPTQVDTNICPMGHFCPRGSAKPEPCQEDHFQPSNGTSTCIPCSVLAQGSGTFGLTGASSPMDCTICPRSSNCNISLTYENHTNSCGDNLVYPVARNGGAALRKPVSDNNNHNASWNWDLEGDRQPLLFVSFPAPGYFRFPSLQMANVEANDPCAPINYIECPGGEEVCPGGPDSQLRSACAEGYDGFLCMGCAEGYALSGMECVTCAENTPYLFAIGAFVLILILTLYLTYSVLRKDKRIRTSLAKASPTKRSGFVPSHMVVSIMKIAYSHLQVIALILSIDVDWHRSVHVIEKFSATVTVTGSDVTSSVMCLFDEAGYGSSREDGLPGFYKKVVVVYLFPFACMVIFALIWLVMAMFRGCGFSSFKEYLHGFHLTTMILLFLAHIILVRTALELFVCTSDDNILETSYLVADPRIECFDSQHLMWFIFAGLGGLIFYGAGIPALSSYLVLRTDNHYLHMFLCYNFKTKFKFWESIVAARKVLLTMFVITLEKFGPLSQGISCLLVLFLAILLQVVCDPFNFPFLNQLELMGMITAMVTLSLAMYSLSFDEEADLVLNILIAGFNLLYMLFICYELFIASFTMVSDKGKFAQSHRRSASEIDPRYLTDTKSEASSYSNGGDSNNDDDNNNIIKDVGGITISIRDNNNNESGKFIVRQNSKTAVVQSPTSSVATFSSFSSDKDLNSRSNNSMDHSAVMTRPTMKRHNRKPTTQIQQKAFISATNNNDNDDDDDDETQRNTDLAIL